MGRLLTSDAYVYGDAISNDIQIPHGKYLLGNTGFSISSHLRVLYWSMYYYIIPSFCHSSWNKTKHFNLWHAFLQNVIVLMSLNATSEFCYFNLNLISKFKHTFQHHYVQFKTLFLCTILVEHSDYWLYKWLTVVVSHAYLLSIVIAHCMSDWHSQSLC